VSGLNLGACCYNKQNISVTPENLDVNPKLPYGLKVFPARQTVVVLDTALQQTPANLLFSYDFQSVDTNVSGSNVHGTVITQRLVQNAPDVNVVFLKVASDSTGAVNSVAVDTALDWVALNARRLNVAAVNLSLGSYDTVGLPLTSMWSDEYALLKSLGVAVVAAAGNDGLKDAVSTSASDANVISVSSVASGGSFASFSNRDADLTDIAAEGGPLSYGGAVYSGTSLSVPLVSAAVARIQDKVFDLYATRLSVDDVVKVLQSSGSYISKTNELPGSTPGAGAGYVALNTDAALNLVADRLALERLGIDLPDALVTTTDSASYAAQVFRLFEAAFCRAPLLNGLSYWSDKLGKGASLVDIAGQFLQTPEFKSLYGTDLSSSDYVLNLFHNVLGRDPRPQGQTYWENELKNGVTRAEVLARFSESPENVANLQEIVLQGIRYEDMNIA
jgi:Domain of unknown function (DUF4214)/Subtilase family